MLSYFDKNILAEKNSAIGVRINNILRLDVDFCSVT